MTRTLFDFDGETYEPEHDRVRLSGLQLAVYQCMRDGRWRTLTEIHDHVGRGSEASISARLRDLRKDRFGGFLVERRRRERAAQGIHEYRLVT